MGSDQHLQIRIQAFEEKMGAEGGEKEAGAGEEEEEEEEEGEGEAPAPQRRYSAGQAARLERREMRFNRSVRADPGPLALWGTLMFHTSRVITV